jgi:hypothetical protein
LSGMQSPVEVATRPVGAEARDPEHPYRVGLAGKRPRVELLVVGRDKQRAAVHFAERTRHCLSNRWLIQPLHAGGPLAARHNGYRTHDCHLAALCDGFVRSSLLKDSISGADAAGLVTRSTCPPVCRCSVACGSSRLMVRALITGMMGSSVPATIKVGCRISDNATGCSTLSQQFEKVSDRAKAAADTVKAANEHASDQLEADATAAREKATEANDQIKAKASAQHEKASSHWQEVRAKWQEHAAKVKKEKLDAKEAARDSDWEEAYAADAIAFAGSAVDLRIISTVFIL